MMWNVVASLEIAIFMSWLILFRSIALYGSHEEVTEWLDYSCHDLCRFLWTSFKSNPGSYPRNIDQAVGYEKDDGSNCLYSSCRFSVCTLILPYF